jgi:NADH dehydrogenase
VDGRVRLVHTPPSLGFGLTRLVGLLLRDVVLTRDEDDRLMAGLLTSESAPTGTTRLADWIHDNLQPLRQSRHGSRSSVL